MADDERGNDGDVAVVDDRALHEPADAVPQRGRGPDVAIAVLLALVGGMSVALWMRSPTSEPSPVSEAVEVEPYQALLGLIATDDFTRALQLWLERESEWTDEQSLRAADECLRRAKQLELVDPAKAEGAALTALKIANELLHYGRSPEAQREGGRLFSDARTQIGVDHPSGGSN